MLGNLGNLIVHIGAEIADFVKGMEKVSKQMTKTGQNLKNVGTSLTTSLTLPLAAVGGVAIKMAADFDKAMTESTAIMGDLSDVMRNDLAESAREVALTTRFSATEAAESYFFLASAGLDAAQSIAALPQVAKFAQAGNFDMALATDLLTDAQSALGLTVDDTAQNILNMTKVSDILVGANTLANASVQQFSESLTNKAGAALRLLGKDLEEGVAVLAVFADQGLKGAESGEALNIVMRDLQRAAINNKEAFAKAGVSVFDANGKMRNMADIIEDLEGLLMGMSDEQKRSTLMMLGFQDKSVSATAALLGTSGAIRSYEKDLRGMGGVTDDVANKQMQNFWDQLNLVKKQFVDVSITLGNVLMPIIREQLMPMFVSLSERLKSLALWFQGLSGQTQKNILITLGLVAALGPVLYIVGTIVTTMGALISALRILTPVTIIATKAQTGLNVSMRANPIGLVILGIVALVAAGVLLYKNWDTVKRVAINAWGVIKAAVFDTVADIVDKYATFIGVFNKAKGAEARATADSLRQRADAEMNYISDRNELAAEEVRDRQEIERLKTEAAALAERERSETITEALEAAKKATDEQTEYVEDGRFEELQALKDTKEKEKAYLDEFTEAFSRSQEDQLTDFKRVQQDEADEFKRGQAGKLDTFKQAQQAESETLKKAQSQRLDEFKRGLDQERDDFARSQDIKRTEFERDLDRQKVTFERAMDDRKRIFEQAQRDEADAFKSGQQQQLNDLKDAQNKQFDILKAAQQAKRDALDEEFGGRIADLRAQQDAIADQEAEEQRTKRFADAAAKVMQAETDLAEAQKRGDKKKIADAQKSLEDALESQFQLQIQEERRIAKAVLQEQIDAARTELDQKRKAQDLEFTAEQTASKALANEQLTALQARLEEDKRAFDIWQENAKIVHQRVLEDAKRLNAESLDEQLKSFKALQDAEKAHNEEVLTERLEVFKAGQEEQKKQHEEILKTLLEHFQDVQSEENKAFQRAEEDRATAYKRELDNLKDSFKDKLAEQRAFVAEWNANAEDLQIQMSDGSSRKPNTGSGDGRVPRRDPDDDEDPIFMAKGGIAKRPVVIGEAKAEVFAPLDELWNRMKSMVNTAIRGTAANFASPQPSFAGGGGNGGGIDIHLEVHGNVGVDDIAEKIVRQIRRENGGTY